MNLPFFRHPDADPGPDFAALVRRLGADPGARLGLEPHQGDGVRVTHGTTVLALRHATGVVMAGDRRATSGNLIANRRMEKVFPADRHSGVAIAGAAGPAIQMVGLFQLQLEHYEKVEGQQLSLDGKANQLARMVQEHLPAAMSGLAVVPIFAGWDERSDTGRLFEFDVTGGRYEEIDHATSGSGSLHAGTVVKLGYRVGMSADEAIDLAIHALFQAADDDSATGGPDLIRGIFPVVADITSEGYRRLDDDDIAERTRRVVDAFERRRAGAEVPS